MPLNTPLTALVAEVMDGPSPLRLRGQMSATAVRERIYRVAADDLRHHAEIGVAYDPANDPRFQWLCEWASIVEGTRDHFSPSLAASARFLAITPQALLSGRDFAAGETTESEPLTLAQGS